ncbi:centromere protein C [Microcaecilia unicolor]|uniref:Centromere protein C n=1 Tax=Microcaecilia unicolor TaxID=1415580 RepID=A0A6P7X1M6_9AMPH|nr:centromere protein C [Microcaecilia unicolor]XP_030046379.1 centromere protein C [Microcaecilia unicolor]
MPLKIGKGQFKTDYRPRYCFLDERLPQVELKLKPGQKTLDFIDDYFKDSGTLCDIDLGSAPLHSSTPNTSKLMCGSEQNLVSNEVKSTGQVKSDILPIQPSTGSPKISSGAGWLPASQGKLNKKNAVQGTERCSKISSVDGNEEDDVVGFPILLVEVEEENPPIQSEGKTTKPYKEYPVENSVTHEPSSPTVQLQIRKRLDFSEHATPFNNVAESKTEKQKGSNEHMKTCKSLQKESKKQGFPSVKKVIKSFSPMLHVQSARENQNGYSKEANFLSGEPPQNLEDEFIISEAHSSDFKSWIGIPKKHKQPVTQNRAKNVKLRPAEEKVLHATEQKNSRKLNLKGTPSLVEQSKSQQSSKEIEEKLHIKPVTSQSSATAFCKLARHADDPMKNPLAAESGASAIACEQNCDKSKKQAKAKMTPMEQVKPQQTRKETEEKLHNEIFSNSNCSPSRSSSKLQQKEDGYELRPHLENQKAKKRRKYQDSVDPLSPKRRNVTSHNTEELCSQLQPIKDNTSTEKSVSSVESEPQNSGMEDAVYISRSNRKSNPPSCWWVVSHSESKVEVPQSKYSQQLSKQSLKKISKTTNKDKHISATKQKSKTLKAHRKQPRLEETTGIVEVSSSKANGVNLSGSLSLRGQNKVVGVDDKINTPEMFSCVSNTSPSPTEEKSVRKQKIPHMAEQKPEKRKTILKTNNQKWSVPEKHSKSDLASDCENDLTLSHLTEKRTRRVSLQHMSSLNDGNVPLSYTFRQSLASFRNAYDKTPVTVKRTSERQTKSDATTKANSCKSQRTPVKSSGCIVNDNSPLQAQLRASMARGIIDSNPEKVIGNCTKESEHDVKQRMEVIQKGIDHPTSPLNVTWTVAHSRKQCVEVLQEGIDCCTSPLNVNSSISNDELSYSLTPECTPSDAEVPSKNITDACVASSPVQPTSQTSLDEHLSNKSDSGPVVARTRRHRPVDAKLVLKEYQSTSDSDSEDLETKRKQLLSKQFVLPSNTPNVRRSKRTRVKPLEYWRGERVNYIQRPSGGFVVNGIIPAKKLIHKKISKQKNVIEKPAGHNTSENVYDVPVSSPSEPATVMDPVTEETTSIVCVKTAESCPFHCPADLIAVSKCFNLPTFSSGTLILGPLVEKTLQFVCLDTIVYYIVRGRLLVTLHCTNYKLKSGDHFYIPPGNMYNIRNLLNEDSVLVYTQIKGEPFLPENS